jgi:uncharacterized protein YjbI with pentapeptide repeats
MTPFGNTAMSKADQKCVFTMWDGKPCGRGDVGSYRCVMHTDSKDPKHMDAFYREAIALVNGTSKWLAERPLDFTGFIFQASPNFFANKHFDRPMIFRNARFVGGPADFSKCVFSDHVDFSGVSFNNASFSGSRFEKAVTFSRGRLDPANFENVEFLSDADFSGSSFGLAVFQSALFKGKATFARVEWGGVVRFRGALFSGSADFVGGAFHQQAQFDHSRFEIGADFSQSHFQEGMDLQHACFLSANSSEAGLSFAGVSGIGSERISFFGVNEHVAGLRIRLLDTDAEKFSFRNVHWYRDKTSRFVLQDELDLKTRELERPITAERVKIAYRQLKKNFEREHDHPLAEDCAAGEMEIRRLDPREPFSSRLAHSVYRFASFYGNSYSRAFTVLVMIPIVGGLLFAVPGFNVLHQRPEFDSPSFGHWPWLFAGIVHAFELATFQRSHLYPAADSLSQTLGMLVTVLVPGQVALFLLALRRRMKR